MNNVDIPSEIISVVYEAMKLQRNPARLRVCLYLMNDPHRHGLWLKDIYRNISKIFPASIPHGKVPSDYKDFESAAVRCIFDAETTKMRHGSLVESERLWENTESGRWCNTARGNIMAKSILNEAGLNEIVEKTVAKR